jgi:ATP-dependent protease ClpP protease subunit
MRVMAESQANILTSVEGACMSAATMVFLSGDGFEISEHSMFMFHNYSGGTIGKGGEMYDNIMYERKWSDRFMRSVYAGFLTDDEIKSILENKDIWMEPEEVFKRLNKRGEDIMKEAEAKLKKPRAKPAAKKTPVKQVRKKSNARTSKE